MFCKACGDQLGDPNEVLHDPENRLGIIEGGVSNPDTAHIKVVDGPHDDDGHRLQCANLGQMTSIVDDPPGEGSDTAPPEGQSTEPNRKPTGGGDVYDFDEDQDPLGIMENVISNPHYDLNDDQIQEALDWGDIHDGEMPPDKLQRILANMSGVSKQKAQLIADKYEARLNKWRKEQAEGGGGPSLGTSPSVSGGSPAPRPPARTPPKTPPPQSGGGKEPPKDSPPEDDGGEMLDEDLREARRKRRVKRRNDIADEVGEEVAHELAREMTKSMGMFRETLQTVIKSKAKRDPDWFLEKADEFGMDVIESLSEPSEAKKRREEEGSASAADEEIDGALEDIMGDDGGGEPEMQPQEPREPQQEQREPETRESNKRGGPESMSESPMSAAPGEANDAEGSSSPEDDGFEEIFDG